MIGLSFPVVLAAAQGGDEQAFAVLWRDLQPAVLRYLRVAAPAAAEELAGEQAVLAEFAVVVVSHPPTLVPRRATMPSKVLRVKAAAAVLVAVLSIGGVAAAASGLLPGQADPVADRAPSRTGAGAGSHGLGQAAVADLDGAAKQGLCRAWQAGQGADHGRRAESVAFQALAAAAGGADKIATFCQTTTAAGGAGTHGPGSSPTSVSPPSTTVSPPSSGPPADPGSGGQGQGGPPTTTG